MRSDCLKQYRFLWQSLVNAVINIQLRNKPRIVFTKAVVMLDATFHSDDFGGNRTQSHYKRSRLNLLCDYIRYGLLV
jgi:hypothetical protein